MGRKLAILPLSDTSAGSNQAYFGDGIADELLYTLTWAEDLQLAPLSSSMRFKGADLDLKATAGRLKADVLLTGSAHHEEGRLSLSVSVLDMTDDAELWSESYKRPLSEIGEVLDDILKNTISVLGLTAIDPDKLTVRKGWTTNPDAYRHYLAGLSHFRRYAVDELSKALDHFERSVKLDPEFARAWARLAECHVKYFMYHDTQGDHVALATDASVRAIELAPDFARAHTARGIAHLMQKEFRHAEDAFDRAISLHPRQYDACFWHARTCFQQGRLKKAVELFEKASEIQPDDYQAPLLLRQARLSLGRWDAAKEAAEKGLALAQEHLQLNPMDARAIYLACGAMIQLGMFKQAMEWSERVLAFNPEDPMINYNVACCFAQVGEKERALDCLEKARGSGMVNVGWMKNDSDLASLRDHPRFKQLLKDMAADDAGAAE